LPSTSGCIHDRRIASRSDIMKDLFCIAALCVTSLSCNRQPAVPRASNPVALAPTNVVSKLNDKGRLSEKLVYATNGLLKHRTVFEAAEDGRILSSRTVDAEGNLKWMDQYSYATASNRPVEMRRTKTNGESITVRFVYSPDGTARKIMTGTDGKPIAQTEHAAFLEE
jgi:hypothetical protein